MEKLTTLDALFTKMGEYTKMETELPFAEFVAYYNDLMAFLQKEYDKLDEEALVKLKGMSMIVAANANIRALHKDENRKKFNKMSEKAKFWEDAIALRLKKSGMSEATLDEKVSALWGE